jgi:DNA-binding LacI/PurR family transcriptional regulator
MGVRGGDEHLPARSQQSEQALGAPEVELAGEHRPTAIFTASDTQALGVIAAAREMGLHVPDDLSVVGYDDIEAADYVGLTTVRQQLFESGRKGAEILLAEIESRSEAPVIAQLTPELVIRVTTASPKEGRW